MKYYILLIISIVLGLSLELISLSNYLEPFRPQFLLMITLFWLHYTKKQFSILSAWSVGLLLDITLFYPLGLNALIFAITAYITKRHNKWLNRISIGQLSLAFMGFYVLQVLLSLIINNMVGNTNEFNFWMFGSIVTSALIWPLILTLLNEACHILKIPSR